MSLALWCSQYSFCIWTAPLIDKYKMKHTLSHFLLMKGVENNESLHDKFLLKISF